MTIEEKAKKIEHWLVDSGMQRTELAEKCGMTRSNFAVIMGLPRISRNLDIVLKYIGAVE